MECNMISHFDKGWKLILEKVDELIFVTQRLH